MKFDKMFPPKYLKTDDLVQPAIYTIREITVEVFGDDKKNVVYFIESEKGLVLNRTNAEVLRQLYGDETDLWTGKKIVAYRDKVLFQGKTVPCCRLREPKKAATAQKPEPLDPDPSDYEATENDPL